MINKRYILFDLDGTLTDPALGITNSVEYALRKFGLEVPDKKELYRFIGPPLIDSFEEFYGFSKPQAVKAVEYYRENFSTKGIYENKLYNGIPELLEGLKKADKTVILATSKPEQFACEILRHFGIIKYFDFVAGATMNETRTKKEEVIDYALKSCSITEPDNAVMVGDRKYDIIGGHSFGIKAIGVLYGYGSLEELESAGADLIAKDVAELTGILL